MAPRRDPYTNARFKLQINGIEQAAFVECAIADTTSDPIEYKWGLSDSKELWDWRKKIIDGKVDDARRNGSVIVLDEEGNPKIQWDFVRGWPSKYDPSDMNAKGNDIAIETLEITHEGLVRA
jgi:phage tail-like protein